MIRLCFFSSWIIYLSGLVTALTVQDGTNAILTCRGGQNYQDWLGPLPNETVISYNLAGIPRFNPALGIEKLNRLSWADNKADLLLSPARQTDEGIYTCSYPRGGDEVNLSVLIQPSTPVISNTVSGGIIWGTEGISLTLSCSSVGGYPVQTVNWYKGSNLVQLPGTPSVTVANGLNNVILNVTFVPTNADDGVTYVCRSSFTGELPLLQSSSVQLGLNLRPSEPMLSLIGSPVEGSPASDIATCSTGGFRPRNISISWTFESESSVTAENLNPVNNSNKFFVTTNFRRAVRRADNGKQLTCSVSHQTLTSASLFTAKTLNILFRPLNAAISGNGEFVANGSRLTLTCTAGESNPAPDIVWYNGSSQIFSNQPYLNRTGSQWNGVVRSQELWLHPTRYMHGDSIKCEVRNTISSSPVTSEIATLNLSYNPIVSVEPSSSLTLTEDITPTGTLTCIVDSSPPSNISWYHGNVLKKTAVAPDGQLVLTINPVTRENYGSYKCVADNKIPSKGEQTVAVSVKFGPMSTVIYGNGIMIANGLNTLTLTCKAGNSNPVSFIQWTHYSMNSTQPVLSEYDSDYGGKIAQSVVTFKPSRTDDGKNVTCTANNELNHPATSTVMLNLNYRPEIFPILAQTAVEGDSHELPCVAHSKPPATFRWYRNGLLIHQTSGTSSANKGSYTITPVNRSHTGVFTCTAENNVLNKDEQNFTFTVQYPPDITVAVQNTSSVTNVTQLICRAFGVPDRYKFNSTWSQNWPGYGQIRDWTGSDNTLTLNQLTYAHSGQYSCSASNGIKVFGTDKQFMHGAGYLLVKDAPVIILPPVTPHRIASELGKNATITIPVFSNIGHVQVSVLKVTHGSKESFAIGTVEMSLSTVQLPVFQHTISSEGTIINISFFMEKAEYFGLYEAVVYNAIGNRTVRINIEAQGPPQPPHDIEIEDVNHNSALISWKQGFHGGFPQSFLIQTSSDGLVWKNDSTVEGGMLIAEPRFNATLVGLKPFTKYFVRILSLNLKGASEYSENKNFTTLDEEEQSKSNSNAGLIGGAAGGSAAAILIVVVGIVVVMRKRQGGNNKQRDGFTGELMKTSREQNEEIPDEVRNPMYISAGDVNNDASNAPVYATSGKKPIQSSTDVYATVDTSKKTKKTADVYATVDTSKKTKKTVDIKKDKGKKKKGMQKQNDIYENPPVGTSKKTYDNEAFENVYENNTPAKSAKEVRPDGLIYADLDFPNQPKGQKRLVIHGLDDKTEYAEVDLTRKADPLPDSDSEEKKTTDKQS